MMRSAYRSDGASCQARVDAGAFQGEAANLPCGLTLTGPGRSTT